MAYGASSYQINELQALQSRAGARITSAIKSASARTGVDFSYLLKQAEVESSFNPTVKAKSSSATGLFQFIESTWLSMVKKYGDKHGLGTYADQISSSGKVSNKAVRNQILALRKDPQIASLLAGEYANENKTYLQRRVGGDIGSTELYMAHFMGANGAGAFLEAMNANPHAKGAALFKGAACSNPAIFYNSAGKPRSLSEIYAFFDNKFSIDDAGDTQFAEAATVQADPGNKPDMFDERIGRWITYKPRQANPVATAAAKAATTLASSMGGIPGTWSLVANPIDIMTLLQFGETDKKLS
jgi:hypothetical protein